MGLQPSKALGSTLLLMTSLLALSGLILTSDGKNVVIAKRHQGIYLATIIVYFMLSATSVRPFWYSSFYDIMMLLCLVHFFCHSPCFPGPSVTDWAVYCREAILLLRIVLYS